MTRADSPVGVRLTDPTRGPLRARLGVYARLAKLDLVDYYLGLLVVWSLLEPAGRWHAAVLGTLVVFLLAEVCVVAAVAALDDLAGYRDGSDAVNYGPDVPTRRLVRKPLVAGTLDEGQVRRFAAAAAGLGALLLAAAVALAPARPGWAIAVLVAAYAVALQYSWGLRLSYHGGQELVIAALGWAFVLAPFGLVAGPGAGGGAGLTGFVVVQAALFGLGPLLFAVYTNTNDAAGDRAVGRPTVAAVLSARGNALFVGAVSAAECALIVGAALTGIAPWWFAMAMAPTVVLRVVQFDLGFRRGDIMRARRGGVLLHRVTVVLLMTVNLAAGGAA